MSKLTRSLVVIAAILLAITPSLPVWRISLIAPQYPEGLGMQIRMNTIEGAKENDLQNINHLNHYIGMRAIEPADMPELQYMRWIVLAIAAAGLGVAAIGRRGALFSWAALFGAAGIAGIVDFWWRTYTYGHTLDLTHAAIQIPGLAYQPPLLGSKQIANFTASAWPASGGIAIGIAAALVATSIVLALRERKNIIVDAASDTRSDAVGAPAAAA
jgi:copper chaperone NosL